MNRWLLLRRWLSFTPAGCDRRARRAALWHLSAPAPLKERNVARTRNAERDHLRAMFMLPFPRCLCHEGHEKPAVHFRACPPRLRRIDCTCPQPAPREEAAEQSQLDLPLLFGKVNAAR
jgi:hypothetical protein